MKYNKIVSLLALGSLFGPTLLASQQAFAEESSTVASNSAATSSSQQTTESSSTGETGSSEAPDPTPTEPTPEPAKQYNLLAMVVQSQTIQSLMQMATKLASNIHRMKA